MRLLSTTAGPDKVTWTDGQLSWKVRLMSNVEDFLLPEGSVLLHIGPYKTGSTAIQAALFAARERLPEYGVEFPGNWRRIVTQGYAALRWAPRGVKVPDITLWQAFCERVGELASSRVCVSTEDFGSIVDTALAADIVKDLGGERVHVVAVARAFDKLMPSQWQERVKTGRETKSYYEWLHDVLARESRSDEYQDFWSSHDLERTAATWIPAVGRDRFTVIASDDSDWNLLPRSFEQMLGLPRGFLELDENSNSSLTMNSAEALRRLNEVFADRGWPDELYLDLVQRGFMRGLRDATPGAGDVAIPPLPGWAVEPVARLSADRISTLERLGIRTMGEARSLLTPVSAGAAHSADFVPTTLSMESALAAAVGLVDGAVRRDTRRRRAARRRKAAEPRNTEAALAEAATQELFAELLQRARRRMWFGTARG